MDIKIKRFLNHNASTILTFVGVAGVIGTSYLTGKATIKAIDKIDRKKEAANLGLAEDLTKKDIFLETWPVYIPAIIVGTTTISCILGANVLNKKNQAMLASAYGLMNQSYRQYRRAVASEYGAEREKEIYEEIVQCNFLGLEQDYSELGEKVVFYDDWYGKHFVSTIVDVKEAIYKLNRNFTLHGDAPLYEFWDMLGLEDNGIGYRYGWSSPKMMDDGFAPIIDIEFRKMELEGERDCYILTYVIDPIETYEEY